MILLVFLYIDCQVKLLSQLEEGSSESDIGSIKRIGSSVSKSRMMAATSRTPQETSSRKTSIVSGVVPILV